MSTGMRKAEGSKRSALRIGGLAVDALVHRADEGGYWAEGPALPGCCTQAETLSELKRNLREAIAVYLAPLQGNPTWKPSR